tara:strand:+ start:291 stop:575 length:285 start_codon:yes stop_codon:yes gene_type:complete
MYCAVEPAQYVVFTDSHILDPVTEPKSPKNNQHDKAIKLNSFGKLLSINLVDVPVEKKKKEELRVRKKKRVQVNLDIKIDFYFFLFLSYITYHK